MTPIRLQITNNLFVKQASSARVTLLLSNNLYQSATLPISFWPDFLLRLLNQIFYHMCKSKIKSTEISHKRESLVWLVANPVRESHCCTGYGSGFIDVQKTVSIFLLFAHCPPTTSASSYLLFYLFDNAYLSRFHSLSHRWWQMGQRLFGIRTDPIASN